MRRASISAVQSASRGNNCTLEVNGRTINYSYFPGSTDTPMVMFLPGFYFSRFRQAKANALEIFAKRNGQGVLIEEYLGIGSSDGDFAVDGTLSNWIGDSVRLIKEVVPEDQKVVLVGAGVGGWIMLHVAEQCKDKVVGLLGINPSLDFTEDLIRPNLTEEQAGLLKREGIIDMRWGYKNYAISNALMEDAKKWLVLNKKTGEVNVNCPVRILQGLSDEELPPIRALDLVDKLASENCVVSFVKFGDHSLETEEDFQRMWSSVSELSDMYYEYDLTSPSSG